MSKMASWHVKVFLFLSSYIPLYLAYIAILFCQKTGLAIAFDLLAILTLLVLFVYFRLVTRGNQSSYKVVDVKSQSKEYIGYILSYIPFLIIFDEHTSIGKIVALLIFFILIGYIYVSSGLIFINPVLSLFGYYLYQIKYEDDSEEKWLLAQKDLVSNSIITVRKIEARLHIQVKSNELKG